jgi:hypothetical protein
VSFWQHLGAHQLFLFCFLLCSDQRKNYFISMSKSENKSENKTPTDILAIVGSRKGVSKEFFITNMEDYIRHTGGKLPDMVISGGALGVDTYAKQWAASKNIPCKEIKPDYENYPGKIAPLIRNKDIVAQSTRLVAFSANASSGTRQVYELALKSKIPCHIRCVK